MAAAEITALLASGATTGTSGVASEASAAADEIAQGAARVARYCRPGRLGKAATRQHIAQVVGEMENRGWTVTGGGKLPEEYIKGANGGVKGSSYPDITAVKNGNTLRVNTVDTLADGVTPTARETANAERIRSQTGGHVLLIPKP